MDGGLDTTPDPATKHKTPRSSKWFLHISYKVLLFIVWRRKVVDLFHVTCAVMSMVPNSVVTANLTIKMLNNSVIQLQLFYSENPPLDLTFVLFARHHILFGPFFFINSDEIINKRLTISHVYQKMPQNLPSLTIFFFLYEKRSLNSEWANQI